MITNHRQYLNMQAQVERFRRALASPDAEGLHPKAARAMRDGLRSQLDDRKPSWRSTMPCAKAG